MRRQPYPRSSPVALVRAQAPATNDGRDPTASQLDALTHEMAETKAKLATLEETVRRFTRRVLDMEARETV